MGSDEVAVAVHGGPRVIGVFAGNGAPAGPNYTLFSGQIGSWWSLGVGLVVGKRLHRTRRRCDSLVLSKSPGSETSANPAITPWPFFFRVLDLTVENNPRSPGVATTAVNKYLLRR